MTYNNKQATVFGGTGFVGRYLVDRLCDLGYTVRVPSRRPHSAYFLRTAGMVGQVVPVFCDIFDDHSIQHAIAGSDIVINLIVTLTEKGKRHSFDALHRDFSSRLASCAASCGIGRFIHISALGADDKASSRYARSKAAGEKAVHAHFPKAIIMRPSLIFGPEDNFFNRFARMMMVSPILPLIGGGHTRFQPVYVEDVVKAILTRLTRGESDNNTFFELAGDDQYTFRELMQKVMAITDNKRRMVSIPFGLARMKGAILQYLPGQLLTKDQVDALKSDTVLTGTKPGLHDLGIDPTPLDAVLPTYLSRYRKGGRFADKRRTGNG